VCADFADGALKWAPNSPDLSVIENVWSHMCHKLEDPREYRWGSIHEFRDCVQRAFNAIVGDQAQMERYWRSIPTRVHQVIEREGDMTDY
jgi:hypothetical protein